MSAISQSASIIRELALDAASIAGPCGQSIDFPDTATIASGAAAPLVSRLHYCEGSQALYQVSVGAPQAFRAALYDLAPSGRRADLSGSGSATAFKAARTGGPLVLGPQDVTLTPNGVV